jgi:hypothetical protein
MSEDAPRRADGDAFSDDAFGGDAFGDDDPRRGAPDAAWRFGIETAGAMAERVQELYRALPSGGAWRATDVEGELRRLRLDLERAADVSLDLFDRVLALLRRIDGPDGSPGDTPDAPDELLVTVPAGRTGSAELWLHNVSDGTQSAPELRCGVVADFDGVALPADGLRVVCADAPIEGRNSRRVEFTVRVPPDAKPGTYHGLIVSRAAPLLTMRVRVVVT